ncbi:MAG: DUF1289 domain-containing protein [Pseudomonadota bacterium]
MDTENTLQRVASPCIRHCTLDQDDVCLGCHRTIDEICAWGGANDDERRSILKASVLRGEHRRSD